jgi:predicted nucleic acid-binding Zn ribbon protein
MIKKKENCEYCGEKMESITAKKRFCSEKCRVYLSRLKSVLKNEPQKQIIGSNLEDVRKLVQIPVQSEKKPILEPPNHLTGIDLIIWKAENKNKNN